MKAPAWAANVRLPADADLDAACGAAGGRTTWLGRQANAADGVSRFYLLEAASMLTACQWNEVLRPWDRSDSSGKPCQLCSSVSRVVFAVQVAVGSR
jgi:hypothetical protein